MPGRDLFAQEAPAEQPKGRDLFAAEPATAAETGPMGMSMPAGTIANAGRALGLGARDIAQGAYNMVSPWADLAGVGLNMAQKALGRPGVPIAYQFPTNHAEEFSKVLTGAGLPEPANTAEKVGSFLTQGVTGAALGGPMNKALLQGVGLGAGAYEPSAAIEAARQKAYGTAPGAAVLSDAGVPLDKSQRTGSTALQRVRSALGDNPITAGAQDAFTEEQNKAYTRAVMKEIGQDSDQATRPVMLQAKKAIGAVFEDVASRSPAKFDEDLSTALAGRLESADRILKPDELALIQKNIAYIKSGVDDTGAINGTRFNRAISDLGALSKRADVGQVAKGIEEDLLAALERSAGPEDRAALQTARQQWRTMRTIEPAIGKGIEKYISPAKLSNAVASAKNRAASIYGQGGNQRLVDLAEAGRQVLPEKLGQSGTTPRGIMAAPLRAILTAPGYKSAQWWMNAQPNFAPPGQALAPEAVGAAQGTAPKFLDWLMGR